MPNPGLQGNKRNFAVKHSDGEPLSRADLQYDLLYYLFADTKAVFTDPFPTIRGEPPGTKVTFRDLYLNAIIQSPRTTKVTKDKLTDNVLFGNEFAKISLLSNIGRINTTMAFFSESRTNLRTYHPIPSLQKSDGNLQDAPRIKNILKSCFLPNENQSEVYTPSDVLAKSRSGQIPPTTVVNLIFMFATHAAIISQTHFASQTNYDIQDFFCPINISSESRARAFLWLCYHYLEGSGPNPFADSFADANPGKIPRLEILSEEEMLLENVDPPDEKEWGEKMSSQRKEFMANKDKEPEPGAEGEDGAKPKLKPKPGPKGKGVQKTAKGERKKKSKVMPPAQSLTTPPEDIAMIAPLEGAQSPYEEVNGMAQDLGSQSMAISPPGTPRQLYTLRPVSPEPSSSTTPIQLPPISTITSGLPEPDVFFSMSTRPIEAFRRLSIQRETPSHGSVQREPETFSAPSPPLAHPSPRSLADPYPNPSSKPSADNQTQAQAQPQSTNGKPVRRRTRKPRGESRQALPLPFQHALNEFAATPAFVAAPRNYGKNLADEVKNTGPVPRRTSVEQAFHLMTTTDPLQDSEDEEVPDENTRRDLLLRLRILNRLRGKDPTPEPEFVP
ncbi:hypothetical protein K474DRAFT_1612014, partial [Panus rudis PR-1116 ss-1]